MIDQKNQQRQQRFIQNDSSIMTVLSYLYIATCHTIV